ncbi:MAG: hemin uptake protein HemP [Pseudomonadota bacterium]
MNMMCNAVPEKLERATVETTIMTPTYNAEDLTEGGQLAYIQLRDQVYTLRITRAGKLILTK